MSKRNRCNSQVYWVITLSTKLPATNKQPTGCCPAQVGFQPVRRLAAWACASPRVAYATLRPRLFHFHPDLILSSPPASVPSLLVVRLRRSPSSSAARRQDGEALDPAGGQPGRYEPGELARPRPGSRRRRRRLLGFRFFPFRAALADCCRGVGLCSSYGGWESPRGMCSSATSTAWTTSCSPWCPSPFSPSSSSTRSPPW